MWKQPYYPPYEESGFELPQNHWRNGFIAVVISAAALFAFAYYVIDANNGFNHGFGEPAKEVRTTSTLTNTGTFQPAIQHIQSVTESKGFDALKALMKETPVVTKQIRKPVAIPVKRDELLPNPETKPLPEPEEPVTAPRIGMLGVYN
jgi:hypothetical protein